MPDFSSLLNRKAGSGVRPSNLPVGSYRGIIKKHELVEVNSKNAKVPAARIHVGLVEWPESVSDADRNDAHGRPIDLSKRQLSRDYTLDAENAYRLDDLYRSCGIAGEGRTDAECLPELHGKEVLVEVGEYTNQKAIEAGDVEGAVRNQVNALKGVPQ